MFKKALLLFSFFGFLACSKSDSELSSIHEKGLIGSWHLITEKSNILTLGHGEDEYNAKSDSVDLSKMYIVFHFAEDGRFVKTVGEDLNHKDYGSLRIEEAPGTNGEAYLLFMNDVPYSFWFQGADRLIMSEYTGSKSPYLILSRSQKLLYPKPI